MRCDPALNYAELFAHPQVEANQMAVEVEHLVRGRMKMVGIPVKLKGTSGHAQCAPPLLGQHSREILLDHGHSEDEMKEFTKREVIRVI